MEPYCPLPTCKKILESKEVTLHHFETAHRGEKFTNTFEITEGRIRTKYRKLININDEILYVEAGAFYTKYALIITCLTQLNQSSCCKVKIITRNGEVVLDETVRVCPYKQFLNNGNLCEFSVVFDITKNKDFTIEINPSVEVLSNILFQAEHGINSPYGHSSNEIQEIIQQTDQRIEEIFELVIKEIKFCFTKLEKQIDSRLTNHGLDNQ